MDACKIWFCPDGERTAKELHQIPTEEREKVWADLSGRESTTNFKREISEDPNMVTNKLKEFDTALRSIPDKAAYDIAHLIGATYVESRAFRLMFLRTTEFDVQASAERMVKHFEMKLELFGQDKLGKKICLSDLEEDDLAVMETGFSQLLPNTDIGGRRMIFDRPQTTVYKTRENFVSQSSRLGVCQFSLSSII
jgi:hypothetical protein